MLHVTKNVPSVSSASAKAEKIVRIRSRLILPAMLASSLSHFSARSASSGLSGGGFGCVDGDERFGEGRVAHVIKFSLLVELPLRIPHIPHGGELAIDPLARRACFAAQLRSDAARIKDDCLRQFGINEFSGNFADELAMIVWRPSHSSLLPFMPKSGTCGAVRRGQDVPMHMREVAIHKEGLILVSVEKGRGLLVHHIGHVSISAK
jgi:hypothetical protein